MVVTAENPGIRNRAASAERLNMGFTELTLRLLLLFFPGIVCFLIVEALIEHKERKPHEVLLFAYLYGMCSYVLFAFFAAIFGMTLTAEDGLRIPPPTVTFTKSLTDTKVEISFIEIGFVTLVAVGLALVIALARTHTWLNRLAQKIGVSRKFGHPNVWALALNMPQIRWAVVRDLARNFMFSGYIRAFSEVEDVAELLLTNVIVYNEQTGQECYRADHIYLSRKKDDITVEFPDFQG
jgi:hypothetical protein